MHPLRGRFAPSRPLRAAKGRLDVQLHQFFGVDYLAVVDLSDVTDAFFQGAVFCDVGAHVDEDEFLDAGGFGHASGAGGAALPVSFAVLGHDLLVVPAHAEHDVGVAGEIDHGVAGLGVAGEDDGLSAFGVESVGEGIEVGLHVLGGRGGYFPLVGGCDGAGSDVTGVDDRRFAGERAAAVLMDLLAERVVDTGDPVVGEDAFLFVENAVGDALSKGRPIHVEGIFLTDRLIPAAEEEAGVVDVVVEVVVREEEVVDVGWPQTGLDELVGCRWSAVEHDLLAIHVGDICRAEAGGRRRRSAGAEDVERSGEFGVGHGLFG